MVDCGEGMDDAVEVIAGGVEQLEIGEVASSSSSIESFNKVAYSTGNISETAEGNGDAGGVQVTCFSEVVDGVTLHFQIIFLDKQIYAWIGCNSAKLGHLYAAAPTRPNNTVSVTSILGGASDNTGSGIARRLVLRTGLNIILACNIPKNSPMLEADAEKKLMQKLINLGYVQQKSKGSSS